MVTILYKDAGDNLDQFMNKKGQTLGESLGLNSGKPLGLNFWGLVGLYLYKSLGLGD